MTSKQFGPDDVRRPCPVFDVTGGVEVELVTTIDLGKMEVVAHKFPLEISGENIAEFPIKFESIHPIYGGDTKPVMFHCYRRLFD